MQKFLTLFAVICLGLRLFSQNVGIGTGSLSIPQASLEIRGAGTTSATNTFMLRNSIGDTLVRVRNDGRIGIGYNGTTYGRVLNIGGTGINLYTANEAGFGGSIFPTDTSLILWSNSNANNYLVFQPSWGNVGVGTYTPNAKLHLNGAMLIGNNAARIAIGYSLSVDGKIMCEALDILPSGSWPDYVFEDDYNLLPLFELEASIRQNKHLPGLPSSAEIKASGKIQVGEMNKKMLEKVEELTLYIIQLKKENIALEGRLSKLE
jgi:hypothetical protein